MNLSKNQTGLLLAAGLVVVLAAIVGLLAFQLGRQATATAQQQTGEAVSANSGTPTTAPPRLVTNTPTATFTPQATSTASPTVTPTFTPSPTPSPTPIVVITHIENLGRLETTEFAMRTIIDLENEPESLWQEFFGTDKLMLVAEGEVVAGFDLTEIEQEDIVVNGTTVAINLPAAEILYSRIDNQRTYVYLRDTGLLTAPDMTLESRGRLLAEQSLVEWAVERGIIEKAEESGRIQLENLLRSLGFTDVTITVKAKDL